jgi:hypothetical protein
MLGLLRGLFGLFDKLAGLWAAREQQNTGRVIERAETNAAIQQTVEKAHEAETIPDPARTKRLRNRFDRSHKDAGDPQ